MYLEQFPDEEGIYVPEVDDGNEDVVEVFGMVQNQLIVNGQVVDFDLRVIIEVCGLLDYSKQKTLVVIEKFKTIRGILFPIKKIEKKITKKKNG